MHHDFAGQDILSVRQFSKKDIDHVFRLSTDMQRMVRSIGSFDLCRGKILTTLFYEPSTRTSSSFIAAMQRLGGSVIPISGVQYSSVAKGETLADTVRTLEAYSDVIVLRHPVVGAAAEAAAACKKPIVNAGDGIGEHPSQALLDLFTIKSELCSDSVGVDGMTVTMLGDLKNGRTVHSLAKLLSNYRVKLQLVSPASLKMPEDLVAELRASNVTVLETEDLDQVLGETNVLYATRVQKERFQDLEEYEKVRNAFIITPETMKRAREKMILMHPFPRVGEISVEVDSDPRAAYFRQIECGLYVRMALLAMVLGRA